MRLRGESLLTDGTIKLLVLHAVFQQGNLLSMPWCTEVALQLRINGEGIFADLTIVALLLFSLLSRTLIDLLDSLRVGGAMCSLLLCCVGVIRFRIDAFGFFNASAVVVFQR